MSEQNINAAINSLNKIKPRVSIGMPVYNGNKFIRGALDSLLAQTCSDFELIISDNASTDGTDIICREYEKKDSRIRYVKQAENLGAWSNFQFVLNEAHGDYFMWAAADDEWEPEFTTSCVEFLDKNEEYGLVLTEYVFFGHLTKRLFEKKFFEKFTQISADDIFKRIEYLIITDQQVGIANLIYGLWRPQLLKDVCSRFSGLDESLIYRYMDIAMLIVALSKAKFGHLDGKYFRKGYTPFAPDSLPHKLYFLLTIRIPAYIRRIYKADLSISSHNDKWTRVIDEIIYVLKHAVTQSGLSGTEYDDLLLRKREQLLGKMKINTTSV